MIPVWRIPSDSVSANNRSACHPKPEIRTNPTLPLRKKTPRRFLSNDRESPCFGPGVSPLRDPLKLSGERVCPGLVS